MKNIELTFGKLSAIHKIAWKQLALGLTFIFLTGGIAFGQCGDVSTNIVSSGSSGTCTFNITISATNHSGSGNSSANYSLYANGVLIAGDGTSKCEFVEVSNTSLIEMEWTGDCNTDFTLSFENLTSPNCNGSTCNTGVNVPQMVSLPVELTHFNASMHDNTAMLKWATESETNNKGFEIKRSKDASRWETIGFIEGMGNSTSTVAYNFIDKNPARGYNYYQLKQLDSDGNFEYSAIRSVIFIENQKEPMSVFPNPTPKTFNVNVHNPNQEAAKIKIYDSIGKLVWVENFERGEMSIHWQKTFELPQRDFYFVMSQVGSQIETQKVIITNR